MNDDLIYQDFEYANSFKLGELTGQKIIQAVMENNISEVKRLMNLPADKGGLILLRLTAKDKNGKTAKELALDSKYEEIIELLK
ncbi:MAG: hypothetical protein KGZ82_09300 [Bacteroidales bacterium]|nr:hypothetical protein [Bacteroidales bacterium]